MDYIELKCLIPDNNEEAIGILIAELSVLGYESFQECEGGINAYIGKEYFVENIYKNIFCVKEKIFGEITFYYQVFEDKNWNEFWEKNFQPVTINDQLLIKAPFHDIKEKYEYEILLEPKMSFGTGHHATTWLMLATLLDMNLHDIDVLDIGCGTGILSVFASMKGARHIMGFDNNDWAYANALENIELNKVNNVNILLGDIYSIGLTQKFDLVLANINRNVILQEMSEYVNYIKQNGYIIFSGILSENLKEVQTEALKNNLEFKETREKDKWVMLKYQWTN